jgi:L-fuconolactonase
MSQIRRDFLPEDLETEIGNAGVDGVVSVQARQKTEETDWLLGLAKEHDFIRGVVGWVPLASPHVGSDLERLAGDPKLKSLRHVLQDESDDDYALRDDFNAGVSLLHELDLCYDILIFERHLPQTIALVDRHPDQVFVVDHIAKPRIRDNVLSPWRENIAELARRENVYCKVSGMATEADFRTWTTEQIRPYFDVVLQAFGPERLMFGSDWPVVLVACEYGRWCETVHAFASELSVAEQRRIFGETADEAYRLSPEETPSLG